MTRGDAALRVTRQRPSGTSLARSVRTRGSARDSPRWSRNAVSWVRTLRRPPGRRRRHPRHLLPKSTGCAFSRARPPPPPPVLSRGGGYLGDAHGTHVGLPCSCAHSTGDYGPAHPEDRIRARSALIPFPARRTAAALSDHLRFHFLCIYNPPDPRGDSGGLGSQSSLKCGRRQFHLEVSCCYLAPPTIPDKILLNISITIILSGPGKVTAGYIFSPTGCKLPVSESQWLNLTRSSRTREAVDTV
nr:uncharacterized protein LOC120367568 [Saimiri boliviensis boliviensis]